MFPWTYMAAMVLRTMIDDFMDRAKNEKQKLPSGYLTVRHGKSPFLIGKPSISMGHLYHGYVSHNQRVCLKIVHVTQALWWPRKRLFRVWKWPKQKPENWRVKPSRWLLELQNIDPFESLLLSDSIHFHVFWGLNMWKNPCIPLFQKLIHMFPTY